MHLARSTEGFSSLVVGCCPTESSGIMRERPVPTFRPSMQIKHLKVFRQRASASGEGFILPCSGLCPGIAYELKLCHSHLPPGGGVHEKKNKGKKTESVQTTEKYLGCRQRFRHAVNDRLGIGPDSAIQP